MNCNTGYGRTALFMRMNCNVWPLHAPYREVRIAAFAEKYGFRLRFYHKGMCAIFDRQPDDVIVPGGNGADGSRATWMKPAAATEERMELTGSGAT